MKTAVEWLIEQLKEQIKKSAHNELETKRTGDYRIGLTKAIEFCEQAKEMEKEQIIESYCQGCLDMTKDNSIFPRDTSEQYYTETFKTK